MNIDLLHNYIFKKNTNSIQININNHLMKLGHFDNKYINQYLEINDKWKKQILDKYITLNIPKHSKNVLYLTHINKTLENGGYVERTHNILKTMNTKRNDISNNLKYYYICIDSIYRTKQHLECLDYLNVIDNVIYINLPNYNNEMSNHAFNQFTLDLYIYIIDLFGISILHSTTFYNHSLLSVLLSKHLKIPHIYEIRGRYDITLYERWGIQSKQNYSNNENLILDNSNAILYICPECKDFVELTNVNVKNILNDILPNCANIPIRDKQYKQFTLFNDNIDFVISYVGTTYMHENFKLILSTISKLINNFHNIGFLFAGYPVGMYKSALNNLRNKFPNNVIIERYLPHSDLINLYYPNIDLFIIPRIDNKISNVITPLKPYDIMANRVPLLMSNLECLTRISDNEKNCLLFNVKKDPENNNLYDKIIKIYNDGYPDDIVENGYNYAVQNSWNSIVHVLEDMNDTLLEK